MYIFFSSQGFLIAIFAIVLAAFSTGIDSKCFQVNHYSEMSEEKRISHIHFIKF
jgi:hypothetical protein